jgi:hypothetical protein
LRATWKLPSAPVSGAAILTCDNAFVLYVNGRKVAASEDWERIEAVPLHDKLQAGANQIVILARNAGNGPNAAGCYFQARVELADGSRADLVSDGSWEFSRNVPAGREGRLGALPTDLRPVAVLPALEVWQAALTRQGPALLAHGEAASGKMVRASLLKGDFLMRSLGRPNRDQIVSMRPEELTTLEAIDLSNGDVLASALARGADRLVGRFGADSRGLLDWIYLQALSRPPTDAEAAAALDVLGPAPASPAVADVLWAVLMQPEFFYVR